MRRTKDPGADADQVRLDRLDGATVALVKVAVAVATGDLERVGARVRDATAALVPPVWLDELILQSVLMTGYPRALAAAGVVREVTGGAPVGLEDGGDWSRVDEWRRRGERVCRRIYGENYEKLRANVRRLHPALDAGMVVEGYGRTLARPGLDLARRELVVIAQVAVLGADRQLHSHLRGGLHAGAAPAVVAEVLELALRDAAPADAERARALWARIVG